MSNEHNPKSDAFWHIGRAKAKLSSPWIRIWGSVRDALHHIDQAELAVNAIHEEEDTAIIDKPIF